MSDQPIETVAAVPQHGAEIIVPLNRLKASPKNARKTPHSPATIEAFAASIKAKGVLQAPVVEIERDGDGAPTGNYLVTIGEGRRQALQLLAKRKAIKRTHPVKVIVDAEKDGHEISLDGNVTCEAMHPADQFEAFKRLADEKGYGPEEIAARFGVSAHVVRQRLRLGAVAPELMAAYREGALTLDQLTAFGVSDDRDRQRQVFGQIGPHTPAYAIRRAMTEEKVAVSDRRVRFVTVEACTEASGAVLRDLFTEDGGGWLEDPALLDRLVSEKLAGLAEADREAIAALSEEYDRLVSETDAAEMLPPEVDARLEELDKALQAFGPDPDYPAEDRARGGVIVSLDYDGTPRIQRGLIRPEDVAPEPDAAPEGEDEREAEARAPADAAADPTAEAEGDEAPAPLPDRLVMDLTAYRTAGLRDALAADATTALTVVVHAMALQVFYPPYDQPTALQLRLGRTGLERFAPGVGESPAGRRLAEQVEAWAERLPRDAKALWPVLLALSGSDLLDLLACCAAEAVNAIRDPHDRRPGAWAHAEALAVALSLDMTTTWSATAASYYGRVSKVRILEAVAVAEGVGQADADRIAGMKKADMAEAAERLTDGKGWLPPLLRTAPAEPVEGEPVDEEAFAPVEADVCSVAAE